MKILDIIEKIEDNRLSKKYLIAADGLRSAVEVVFLDMGVDRVICASAQAGCTFGCTHCATTYSSKPFIRNLSADEIVSIVRFVISDANTTNPVDVLDFSGVGDCSANWAAVRDACLSLHAEGMIARYTVTSIAPVRWCQRVVSEIQAGEVCLEKIAISLHGADLHTRRLVIPHAEDPVQSAEWWQQLKSVGCRINLNYVMHSQNTTARHAAELSEFLRTHKGWVDMLRLAHLNPVSGMVLSPPSNSQAFAKDMSQRVPDIPIVVFSSNGQDQKMGCGQMRAFFTPTLNWAEKDEKTCIC